MKIHGLSVMKNEESRYLKYCLEWNAPFFDDWFIWDDRSTDGSVNVAESYATVAIRCDGDSSFMEHEGRYRQDAWNAFEATMKPEHKDLVVAIDLDEFLTLRSSSETKHIRGALEAFAVKSGGYVSQDIPFIEVFDVDGQNRPSSRSDGFWNTISAPRLFSYKEGGKFPDRPMGCGSVPEYVLRGSSLPKHKELVFLHYGYAVFEDRVEKFDRYSSLEESGHNAAHINSILGRPELTRWNGPFPLMSEK
jgi:hypothetical protein